MAEEKVDPSTDPLKAGTKTSEFKATVVIHLVLLGVVGVGLYKGDQRLVEIAVLIMGFIQGTYTIGRSMTKVAWVKAATDIFNKAGPLLLLVVLVGCGSPGYVKASAIEGTTKRIIERHDTYTDADATLSDLQKKVNKRDGELILELFEEAQKEPE